MQESMDKAKSGFLAGSIAEASRIVGDDTGSDENLSIREGDNIGRSGIVEKGPVHASDRTVADNGRLDLFKSNYGRSA
jgi:hypothetical protein